jgi:hypothetical protein
LFERNPSSRIDAVAAMNEVRVGTSFVLIPRHNLIHRQVCYYWLRRP